MDETYWGERMVEKERSDQPLLVKGWPIAVSETEESVMDPTQVGAWAGGTISMTTGGMEKWPDTFLVS